jgi:hypothetical protein
MPGCSGAAAGGNHHAVMKEARLSLRQNPTLRRREMNVVIAPISAANGKPKMLQNVVQLFLKNSATATDLRSRSKSLRSAGLALSLGDQNCSFMFATGIAVQAAATKQRPPGLTAWPPLRS